MSLLEMLLTAGALVAAVTTLRFAIADLDLRNATAAALAFVLKKA